MTTAATVTDDEQDLAPPEPVADLLDELRAATAREDRQAVASTLRELAAHYGVVGDSGSVVLGP